MFGQLFCTVVSYEYYFVTVSGTAARSVQVQKTGLTDIHLKKINEPWVKNLTKYVPRAR